MKIIKLTAENVKRLKAVEIKPDGNLVVIGGRNKQGKSSTLDSIAMAFGGKRYIPLQPVRRGEKKAKIICETDDLIVTRTMTPEGGGTLKVGTKDGKVYQSPQSILDAMTGQLTFDPLAFSRMDDKAQLNTLKALVGLDFSQLDQKRSILYEDRATVNREGKRLVGVLESKTNYPNAPDKEVLVSDLMKELKRRTEINDSNNKERVALDDLKDPLQDELRELADLEEEMAELTEKISKSKEYISQMRKEIAKKERDLTTLKDEDTQEIVNQISSAEETNRQVRTNQEMVELNTEIEGLRTQSQELTDKINQIDEQKAAQLSEAKFPIEGLSFDEDGVLFEDTPFSQLADSEKLQVSTAMGFAMNPELKILLIRNGSLLDQENLELMAEMAKNEDAQIWIERVGEGQEVSVIIEDGSIKQ